ncbi:MAG: ABC transporter permease subunit [Desulfurococcales archaeon]|nr:ABC transporter permease subunit [Desulfurococcales archaeon]
MKLKQVMMKEVKELLKERTVLLGVILGPIIIFVIFAGMSMAAGQQALEQAEQVRNYAIIYRGQAYSDYANMLADSLGVPIYLGDVDPSELLEDRTAVVIIDDEFFDNITRGIPGRADIIVMTMSLNFLSMSLPQQVEASFTQGVYNLVASLIKASLPNVDEWFLQRPVVSNTTLYYRGMPLSPGEAFGLVFGVGLSVTMATMILVMSSMQVAATSVGIERESKTLEMLLSLPVSRRELILGKILGVAFITGLGIISYAVGIGIYFYSLGSIVNQAPEQGIQASPTISMTPLSIVAFMVGLTVTLVTSLLIGMVVGSIPQDVRGAQLASSYVGLLLLAPVFAVFFGIDLTSLEGVWSIVYLDPVVLLYLVIWGVVTGDHGMATTGFAGLLVNLVVWVVVASRALGSEAILVGGYSRRLRSVFRAGLPRSSS